MKLKLLTILLLTTWFYIEAQYNHGTVEAAGTFISDNMPKPRPKPNDIPDKPKLTAYTYLIKIYS